MTSTFAFADLFAGIGGFHAALAAAGGQCVFASEIDPHAASVYERMWGSEMRTMPGRPVVEGDIIPLTDPDVLHIPDHDVLTAGFPCQPFSKSGHQRGINETRGTLFFNIARILEERRPSMILLENVRNLAGPRHRDTWTTIVRTLRDLGYRVSDRPTVFSPHLLPPDLGGTPQVRDRVFITGTYVGSRRRAWAESEPEPLVARSPVAGWDPICWDLDRDLLQPDSDLRDPQRYALSTAELMWVEVWEDFVQTLRHAMTTRLPGFPLWADAFVPEPEIADDTPDWKADFLRKNSAFYLEHRHKIDAWLGRHNHLADLPPSRRKLEWQAQDTVSLWESVMHFRPSGIRAKRPTYLPALVAITQTSVIGSRRRRITPREASRLQGLPDWFDFGDQPDKATYKQLGNGVAVGAAYYVFRTHVIREASDLPGGLVSAVNSATKRPEVPRPHALHRAEDDVDLTVHDSPDRTVATP